ncbi:MAG TPA: DNA mismatch repair protein MutL, partial [Verrucomicrobiae bacterium]|nr:DNA mismatch repair protein MutL [Verrucomicrobiae bacterium]
INPAAVDVNIHPAKREVKFHREFEIRKYTAQAVREALLAFHSEPARTNTAKFEQPEIIPSKPLSPAATAPQNSTPTLPQFPEKLKPAAAPQTYPAQQTPSHMGFSPRPVETKLAPPVSIAAALPSESAIGNRQSAIPISQSQLLVAPERSAGGRSPQLPVPLLDVPLRMVGVIGKLYVVLESDRGLVLLDQHAAHERILFEQMMTRIESNTTAPSQKLLLPETVELPPRDAQFLREQLPALLRLGVGLNEFGERTFLLDALPPFVKAPDARRFVFDLVDELRAAGREVNLARLGEHTVAKTVCRHAVKANDPLGGPELENLVEDLRRCAMPYTCPHGRPTLIEMNFRELEKKFGRVQ